VPKLHDVKDEQAFPALGVSQKELEEIDKYQYDVEELLEMGYEFL
jgi:hypothetical protein